MSKLTAVMLLIAALALAWPAPPAQAHDPRDVVFEQVGVDERPGSVVPAHLVFTDQGGRSVQLSRYLTGSPVILTLNYYSCPTLCPLVFRNLAGTIAKMGNLKLGRDFRVVAVSIDPEETVQRAAGKSSETYAMLGGIPDPGSAWPFLLGGQPSIQLLARSLGIRYTKVDNEYAHPNVIVILTPEGKVSRYLYGLEQAPQDLKLSLLEAADGDIGGSRILNRALLYCFHYDPIGKKYVLLASRVMTGAMAGVLLVTAGLLAVLWKREKNIKGERHA